jgi:uncharacterized protein YicC (UPF0701 family)
MKKEISMRKEYDFRKGERGKFYGKVDTANPIVETEDESLDEIFEDELTVLESNLARIKNLKSRLSELDSGMREKIVKRISNASEILDEIALPQ